MRERAVREARLARREGELAQAPERRRDDVRLEGRGTRVGACNELHPKELFPPSQDWSKLLRHSGRAASRTASSWRTSHAYLGLDFDCGCVGCHPRILRGRRWAETTAGTPGPVLASGQPEVPAAPDPDLNAPHPDPVSNPVPDDKGGSEKPQPSLSWTQPANLAAQQWHWTSANPAGSVMVATAITGGVHVSRDGGASWTVQAGLSQDAIWISADMSDDGQVIVVVALNGGMYRSLDSGASWSRIDTSFNAAGDLDYESVSLSADGKRIVAAVMGGGIWASSDGTAAVPAFTAATDAAGVPLAGWWRAVDSDATGMRVVAASHNGDVWVSDDAGASFAPLAVAVEGTPVADGWYRLALSRDGNTVALAGNEEFGIGAPAGSRSSGLYVGRFAAGGWTFQRASATAGNYTRVAIAAAAPVVAATLSGAQGAALISTDNGATFSHLATPDSEAGWRSIALTGDGSRAVLAAGTFFGAAGRLYLSSGPLAP